MKQYLLFFAVMFGIGIASAQAQSCTKSTSACCKKSASVATADKAHCAGSAEAAAKLASLDESIETRTCEKSGTVSYVRRDTDPQTGNVVFTSVEYNSELGKFVNVSPSAMKSCCAGHGAGCCAGKAKVTQAEASEAGQARKVSQKGS